MAADLLLGAGSGTGTNAGGGDVTITAGNALVSSGSPNYALCDTQSSYGAANINGLTLAQYNKLIDICSPGDLTLVAEDTKIEMTETMDLEASPVASTGSIKFEVDGVKVFELSEEKVETFAAMTVNGFDLQVSDRRIKRNITDATTSDALDLFRKLRLREYSLHPTYAASSGNPNKVAKGFIAQEVAEVLPHAVRQYTRTFEAKGHDDLEVKDMNHVQYDYIYLEMFGAVKELVEQVDELHEQVQELEEFKRAAQRKEEAREAEMRAQKEDVSALKAQMAALLAKLD